MYDPTDNLAGKPYWPVIHSFVPNPINDEVTQVVEMTGASIQVSGPAFATALGDEDTVVSTSKLGMPGAGVGGAALPPGWAPAPAPEAAGGYAVQPGPVVLQATSRVGAGDVVALGDANLWDQGTYIGDGRMTLYHFHNAQLAFNILGRGEWCRHCPVALVKERDPYPTTARLAATSQASPPAPVATSRDPAGLDEAGNLPSGPAAAPVAPLALGDVVNSFPAPENTRIDLEWIDGFLWGLSTSRTLYRLAPSDGTILERLTLPAPIVPLGLTWDGSSFWVADFSNDKLWHVDRSGAIIGSIASPGTGPAGLAWDGVYLWDVDWAAGQLHRIVPASGAVVGTLPAPDIRASGLAWDGRSLWVNGRVNALTYKLDPVTGTVLASFATPPGVTANNGQGLAFDGRYLWVSNMDTNTIYQVDVDHVPTYVDPNEQILRDWSTPYDVWAAADLGVADPAPYCRVVVESDQPRSVYQAASDHRDWLEPWIAAGGILELHGAASTDDDWAGLPMPGGWSMVRDIQSTMIIVAPRHPIVTWPHAIGAEFSGWECSSFGYLVGLPAGSKPIIAQPSGQPATAEIPIGEGCVLATTQTLEYAWLDNRSPILENVILSGCMVHVYLPVVLRRH